MVQGDIRVNGSIIDASFMRQFSGFMYQDEFFIGSLTVSEHMWFMVSLITWLIGCRNNNCSVFFRKLFDIFERKIFKAVLLTVIWCYRKTDLINVRCKTFNVEF